MDIAGRADIALISIPAGAELAGLVQAIAREISGGASGPSAGREEGLNAVLSRRGSRGRLRRTPRRGEPKRSAPASNSGPAVSAIRADAAATGQ